MPSLADELLKAGRITLGIATNILDSQWSARRVNRKVYYDIPMKARRVNYSDLPLSLVQSYLRVVEHFKPDVIHIHGTEYFHGLLTGRKHIDCPAVISIQGILDVCKEHYLGGIPLFDILRTRTLRDWIRFDGLLEQKLRMYLRAEWERKVFASNTAFIGRTQWDEAHTRRMNPTANYYHCDEMLRPIFYETRWKLAQCNRHTIYAPSGSDPLKGLHVLLKAVSLLRHEFPDLQLRVPLAGFYHTASGVKYVWKSLRSGGYARYLTQLIEKDDLGKYVVSLGVCEAAEVANELMKAHVFVLPSFIENSPNSLAEAMLVGTPCATSFAGGVPSMVNDGESALCFPPADAVLLAEQMRGHVYSKTAILQTSFQSVVEKER